MISPLLIHPALSLDDLVMVHIAIATIAMLIPKFSIRVRIRLRT